MSPKDRFQILLEPEQIAALEALREETKDSVAWHVRQAINDYLKRKPVRKPVKTKTR